MILNMILNYHKMQLYANKFSNLQMLEYLLESYANAYIIFDMVREFTDIMANKVEYGRKCCKPYACIG